MDAEEGGDTGALSVVKERLDTEYGEDSSRKLKAPLHQYDPDAFDSMAVMNSEIWNVEHSDGRTASVKDLLPKGPQNLSVEEQRNIILKAAENGSLETVAELHQCYGSEVLQVRDDDLYTPLHRACYNGHLDVVQYLVTEGPPDLLEAETVDRWRPLHCACRWNKVEVACLLVAVGADVNSQTNGGQTPLHLAGSNDRARETLEFLLSLPEINVELENGQGEVALQVAERNGPFAQLFVVVDPAVDHRKFLST